MKRKKFLKSILGASAFLGIPYNSLSHNNISIQDLINNTKKNVSGSMFGFSTNPIKKVRVAIIGLGNRGNILLEMFQYLIQNSHAEIIALSDIIEEKVSEAASKITLWQDKIPVIYYKSKNEWKKLVKRDDIDLIIIASISIL